VKSKNCTPVMLGITKKSCPSIIATGMACSSRSFAVSGLE
jgi:hypothetical protein